MEKFSKLQMIIKLTFMPDQYENSQIGFEPDGFYFHEHL